jgi:hypothetical protein
VQLKREAWLPTQGTRESGPLRNSRVERALPAIAGIRIFVHGKLRVAARWFEGLASVAFIRRGGKHDLPALVSNLAQ